MFVYDLLVSAEGSLSQGGVLKWRKTKFGLLVKQSLHFPTRSNPACELMFS